LQNEHCVDQINLRTVQTEFPNCLHDVACFLSKFKIKQALYPTREVKPRMTSPKWNVPLDHFARNWFFFPTIGFTPQRPRKGIVHHTECFPFCFHIWNVDGSFCRFRRGGAPSGTVLQGPEATGEPAAKRLKLEETAAGVHDLLGTQMPPPQEDALHCRMPPQSFSKVCGNFSRFSRQPLSRLF